MHTNPLVSVLIPSYNHENYIQETIKSIIEQTYKNIELIIIDDGSKDFTWQKIQELKTECESRFSNVYFEAKENEGTCKTFNKLLSMTQGEYVYIIASDDLAKPTAIETFVNFLKNNPNYALAVGDNEIIDNKSQKCFWDKDRNNVYDNKQAKWKTFGDFLKKERYFKFTSELFGTYETLYTGNYIPNGYLIRKSIFEKTGYFTPEAPLEDWYLMLQISKYSKMKYFDEVLFSYRWHETNTIRNLDKAAWLTKKTKEYEEEILKNINPKEVLKDVIKVKENGACFKKQGIPYLIELITYKKYKQKIKKIKLFGINVLEYTKK